MGRTNRRFDAEKLLLCEREGQGIRLLELLGQDLAEWSVERHGGSLTGRHPKVLVVSSPACGWSSDELRWLEMVVQLKGAEADTFLLL